MQSAPLCFLRGWLVNDMYHSLTPMNAFSSKNCKKQTMQRKQIPMQML